MEAGCCRFTCRAGKTRGLWPERMESANVLASSEMFQRWFWELAPWYDMRRGARGQQTAEHTQAERDFKSGTLLAYPDPDGKEGLGDHAGQLEQRTARTRRI